MTAIELIKWLECYPEDMPVVIEIDKDTYSPICKETSDVIPLEDAATGKKDNVLLLLPCYCPIETDEIPIDIHPN